MGGRSARPSKQSFPANRFDIEISDKQKIESLICSSMRDHLVISKSWLKGCVMNASAHHESKDGYLRRADRSSQTQCDFTVINSDSFISSHLAVSHQNSLARSVWKKPQFLCVWRSQLPAPAKASLDVPLSSLLLWRGIGNSLCEMIFEVIKESHSVELTVLMESRNRSSSPNSQTGLLTAAGGAQRTLGCGDKVPRGTCSLILFTKTFVHLAVWETETGNRVNTELLSLVWLHKC